jgi:hypothetical protein
VKERVLTAVFSWVKCEKAGVCEPERRRVGVKRCAKRKAGEVLGKILVDLKEKFV